MRYIFFGLPLDPLSLTETVGWVESVVEAGASPKQHTVINAAKVVKARKDAFLAKSIQQSDLVNADGQAIVWAARLLGMPVPERVAGIDLMRELLQLADRRAWRVYFLGAEPSVLDRLVEWCRSSYPNLVIAGSQHGYFTNDEEVAQAVRESRAQLLFVGMPTPRKEQFINQYLTLMNVPFSMGVGGSFDVFVGKVRRAPLWMQRSGLEWFYRLIQEPRRMFWRYFTTNFQFVGLILSERFRRLFG